MRFWIKRQVMTKPGQKYFLLIRTQELWQHDGNQILKIIAIFSTISKLSCNFRESGYVSKRNDRLGGGEIAFRPPTETDQHPSEGLQEVILSWIKHSEREPTINHTLLARFKKLLIMLHHIEYLLVVYFQLSLFILWLMDGFLQVYNAGPQRNTVRNTLHYQQWRNENVL
jgi:hypothetical protein